MTKYYIALQKKIPFATKSILRMGELNVSQGSPKATFKWASLCVKSRCFSLLLKVNAHWEIDFIDLFAKFEYSTAKAIFLSEVRKEVIHHLKLVLLV